MTTIAESEADGMEDSDHEAATLTQQEDAIFASMVDKFPETFKGKLYRDGVPRPDVYLSESIRVLFVFLEPNSRGKPYNLDMRKMVRHPDCGRIRPDGVWKTGSLWWDKKVPLFGHAVVHALAGDSQSFAELQELIGRGRRELEELRKKRTKECVFPFAFINIKKSGGDGQADTDAIVTHADDYREFLKQQVQLYKPHLIIGCGGGSASPARLLHKYVVLGGVERRTVCLRPQHTKGFKWWQFSAADKPVPMLEFYHPSFRGSRKQPYCALAAAVAEIACAVGLCPPRQKSAA